uniref:CSON005305 protein n=1 Tax=Culicoides sonorensis TaxID=179676 RepID=A0A336LV99_CULSO
MKFLFVIFALFFVAVSANTYGYAAHHQHVQPVGHESHSYAAHAPKVDCGSNVLAGCVPTVAQVPCVPSHGGHGYGHKY